MEGKLIRTAREIKVSDNFLEDVNLNVTIGAAEKRNRPETIYIELSFWIKNQSNKIDKKYLRRKFKKDLNDIYNKNLNKKLTNNFLFPNKLENLFIINMPENIYYNDKKNFVSIELYLHTINNDIKSTEAYPLSKKKNTEIYNEALSMAKIMCESEVLNSKFEFEITKKK